MGMSGADKTFARRMTVLRMRLESERNNPKPDQKLIDSMMAEYKRLETASHVRLVFGDRGYVEEMSPAEHAAFTEEKMAAAQEFIDGMAGDE